MGEHGFNGLAVTVLQTGVVVANAAENQLYINVTTSASFVIDMQHTTVEKLKHFGMNVNPNLHQDDI